MLNLKKLAMGLSVATLITAAWLPGVGSAQNLPGYAVDAGTKSVVRNAYDECWKTSSWNEDQRIAECGGILDSDGDGVTDDIDQCPGTPPGVKVDAVGCPLDTDGDGVPDFLDKCPGTPPGAPVDSDGCQIDHTIVISTVNFAFDSAALDAGARGLLDENLPHLANNPKLLGITVNGHTDSRGSAAYNQGLSERRAQSVANYLANNGVPASKLTVVGHGESQPIASNNTSQGRAENRRVELDIDVQ